MLRDFFSNEMNAPLDEQINAVLEEMRQFGVNSEEYPTLMTYLERLTELKAKERRPPVSRDAIAFVVGNLLMTLVIVAYEQKHVMTSKGFSLIRPNYPK